jgi:uncharacterized protein YfeS
MRQILLTIILISISSCSNWYPDFKKAHPNAKVLMKDEFLWSPIEVSSPFGNDDGADAIYDFHNWRKQNADKNPMIFIEKLLGDWNYKTYNYYKIDTVEIRYFINSYDIGDRVYLGIDDVIISVAFGQLILEGKIDKDLKTLALTALNRQMLPISIKMFDTEYQNIRIKHQTRMIEIINAT